MEIDKNKSIEYYLSKMSPESIKIYDCTKWNKNNFTPSFKETDKVLMKAAKKTYKELYNP